MEENGRARRKKPDTAVHVAEVLDRRRLSDKTVEIALARPESFHYEPGQRIRFIHADIERDYSLISAPQESVIALCARIVAGGRFSSLLAAAAVGDRLTFSGPHGYFLHHPSPRHTVFVATGTGIAPFVSMARAGLRGFTLLHGVRSAADLYYEALMRSAARRYVPCLGAQTGEGDQPQGAYPGRVTRFLEREFPQGAYDFYLCGRREMIRDVTLLVDDRFPGSNVYSEIFF